MKKKRIEAEIKPLAEHLAKYLVVGIDRLQGAGMPMDFTEAGLTEVFEQALKTWALWKTGPIFMSELEKD